MWVNIIILTIGFVFLNVSKSNSIIAFIGLMILNIQCGFVYINTMWQNGFIKEYSIVTGVHNAKLEYATSMQSIDSNDESSIISDFETKSLLTEEKTEQYLTKILLTIEKEKPYLQKKCTLKDIADLTDIPVHHVSNVINNNLNKNFSDFINEYKIEAAQDMLLNKSFSNLTIEAIGLECGFGTKKSFYTAFKKYTNLTPTEFREQ
jgi:YesN/AraC family two-component response regulator